MREIDPKIFGPGTWIVLHVLAIVCDESATPEDNKSYCQVAYRIIHALPCSKCRKHAVTYMDAHVIPKSKAEGSIFEWTVAFHNAVNKKLKKPLMALEDARAIYSNTEVVLTNHDKSSTCKLTADDNAAGGCEDKSL